MRLKAILDSTVTLLLAGTALTVLLRGDRATQGEVETIEDWQALEELSLWVGSPDAAVIVTEFVDFQCPYCARVQPVIDSLLVEWGDDLAVAWVHYPLGSHDQAVPAAIAVECAAEQGAHAEYGRSLLEQQPRLGSKPWLDVAESVDLADLAGFSTCLEQDRGAFPRIDLGLQAAEDNEIRGTPALFVNGSRSSRGGLAEAIADAMAGGVR